MTKEKIKDIIFGFLIILGLLLPGSEAIQNLRVDIASPVDDYGIEVSIQDYNAKIVSLFLTKELQLTNLSNSANINSNIINVSNSTNCLIGDAIDLYDDDYYFQGIIINVVGNDIVFTPDLDYSFNSSNTYVKCGEWNMNVDGSTTPQEYYINAPLKQAWDIESIGMQFQDNSDWDINSFGSRTALTNGLVMAIEDGYYQKMFLIDQCRKKKFLI